jgi:hypothetical protein
VKIFLKFMAQLVVGVAFAGCNANVGSSSVPGTTGEVQHAAKMLSLAQRHEGTPVAACMGTRLGRVQCDALFRAGIDPNVSGLSPAAIQAAYNLPSSTRGSGQIVAVVDAYDNPDVASDLATYRSHFGLPAANFTKYNQKGKQRKYPSGNTGWGVEIDLDVEMVSASCPLCTIYLIEANSNGWSDIQVAEEEAVKLGATIVSNSFSGTGGSQSYFDSQHVTYLASTGDNGYGISDPADFRRVVAVGGTTLTQGGHGRGWTESIWSGTGAGCSAIVKPKWQHDPGCKFRTANDVSAVADPYTGVAEFDTYAEPGWVITGGTSVSSPLMAGVFALAGNSKEQDGGKTFWNKSHQKHLYPVLTGNDGDCGGSYLCTAGTKQYGTYSGPGGWGTPNGTGAF